jgi:biopolymer transport protein ExbD/biopolymer transport protein TolR
MLGLNMVRVSPRGRPKNRTNHLICSIDVSAFVAIMIFFLALFMPVGPWCDLCKSISVDMPKVAHPVFMRAADREDAIIIAISRDGRIFIGGDTSRVEDVAPRIRKQAAAGAEKNAYIKADARAKYAWVKEVLDAVRDSGVEKIAFLVDQRKPPLPAAATTSPGPTPRAAPSPQIADRRARDQRRGAP